jgi:protoheme IX farnesyltransferase
MVWLLTKNPGCQGIIGRFLLSTGSIINRVAAYIGVLKPLPSALLTFIGVCTAIIAGEGKLTPNLFLVAVSILLASAGANGLTNYLDREIDARMQRTKDRALPSKRIYPPQKVLPLIAGLILGGLFLAWQLHPLVFLADLVATIVAATWRKKVTCVYPQGVAASCGPVVMGWFAVRPLWSWEILLLCILIAAWVPLHVWSVVITNREDYLRAGLSYFPINTEVKNVVKVLLFLSLVLYTASITIYFISDFSWLYLALANLLGVMMIFSSLRLVYSQAARDAWRLYRLSSLPYLGVIFLGMSLDIWLFG